MATNRFVQIYKDYQAKGKPIDEAFILTVQKIALRNGTIEDLQKLEKAHSKDVNAEFDQIIKELGVMFNEQPTSAV